jgi:hypothetical protein
LIVDLLDTIARDGLTEAVLDADAQIAAFRHPPT